jgi:hypothetical protein
VVTHVPAVIALLGMQELLQLAMIKKDAPAILALLQAHPLLVDGTEGPMAFRTCHAVSIRVEAFISPSAPTSRSIPGRHWGFITMQCWVTALCQGSYQCPNASDVYALDG